MRPAPNSYSRKEKKEMKAIEEAQAEARVAAAQDEFAWLVQKELEALLKMALEPKEKNAVIANAIRFLGVRNKLGGDDDGFWGND
jgi:hypothetical protein